MGQLCNAEEAHGCYTGEDRVVCSFVGRRAWCPEVENAAAPRLACGCRARGYAVSEEVVGLTSQTCDGKSYQAAECKRQRMIQARHVDLEKQLLTTVI